MSLKGLDNVEKAISQAARYVRDTWQQVVMGAMSVPGAKEISSNIGLRQMYSDSIVLGQLLTGMSVSQRVIATKQIAREIGRAHV